MTFIHTVEEALARLESKRISALRFPDHLERRLSISTLKKLAHRRRLLGWLVTGVYVLLLFCDALCIPERLLPAIIIRGLIVVPWLIFSTSLHSNTSKHVRQTNIMVTCGIMAVSNFILYGNLSAALSVCAQVSVLISLLIATILFRMRYVYAMASTALCIASELLYLHYDTLLSLRERFACAIPIIMGALFIMLASYSLEREERRSFLFNLRNEHQREQLTALNRKLARLSAQDALSGLSNRAEFDRRFAQHFHHASVTGEPLSLVLLDIDHFKIVNDTQGHLYGDEVIRRVASIIAQSLRGKDDFAARYGGEEFVLVLPNTVHKAAFKVAERLRRMIELAGSPALSTVSSQPALGLFTTISAGIATFPGPNILIGKDLLHAADTALYSAKNEGRNRVYSAQLSEAQLEEWSSGMNAK